MTLTAPPTTPASALDPLALVQLVREVAELAELAEPETISTRAWDAARALSNRHADAPAARRIAEHLDLSWSKVRELAFMDARGRSIALGHALNERQGGWLTPEYSDFVLRLIARRLEVRTLTPGQYRAERAAMLAEDGRRTRHGGQLRLPTDTQVEALAGSWDRALSHAGLRARHGNGGQRSRAGASSIVEVLDRCYEHHCAEPTSSEIEVFARANAIPFPRRERGRPWSDYLREWKDRRRDQGLDVPDGPPPKALRPDYSEPVGGDAAGRGRKRKAWDDPDEAAEWVARYLRELPRGQRVSKRHYDGWAGGTDGAPWSSTFDQHGGWAAVLDQARQMRATN